MKPQFLELLVCPACKGPLSLTVFHQEGGEVMEGLLECSCGEWFPVLGGVPRMLLGGLRGNWSDFIRRNGIDQQNAFCRSSEHRENKLKMKTAESFGYEWNHYDRFGWEIGADGLGLDDDSYHDLEETCGHSAVTFARKTLLSEEDYAGRIVLDAGCGNGRYLNIVAQQAKYVVGLDLSDAVVVASENIGRRQNVHLAQCDIFNPPFREKSFSTIYTIGVIHHTPSAHEAFLSLARLVRAGGILSVHVYHKGNAGWTVIDRCLRLILSQRACPFACSGI